VYPNLREKADDPFLARLQCRFDRRQATLVIERVQRLNPFVAAGDDHVPLVLVLTQAADGCDGEEGHVAGGREDLTLTGVTKPRMDTGQYPLARVEVGHLATGDSVVELWRVGDDEHLVERAARRFR